MTKRRLRPFEEGPYTQQKNSRPQKNRRIHEASPHDRTDYEAFLKANSENRARCILFEDLLFVDPQINKLGAAVVCLQVRGGEEEEEEEEEGQEKQQKGGAETQLERRRARHERPARTARQSGHASNAAMQRTKTRARPLPHTSTNSANNCSPANLNVDPRSRSTASCDRRS